jgi:hypothetical protein
VGGGRMGEGRARMAIRGCARVCRRRMHPDVK